MRREWITYREASVHTTTLWCDQKAVV